MHTILQGISHLIAPRVCRICGKSLTKDEDVMCLECFLNLPRTGLHREPFNLIHERLGHHVAIDRAAAWYYYRRNSAYAQMLVDAKYRNLPSLARRLGRMCAEELSADGFFSDMDVILPMPMHWFKRLKRGYNQAEEIAKGINEVTGIPIDSSLKAKKAHGVQSRNSRQQRYESISNTLQLAKADSVENRSVLFVDDIITTGASAAEALRAIGAANPREVNVLCVALTALQ